MITATTGHKSFALLCGRCGIQAYCSRQCQRNAWKDHKKVCVPPSVGALRGDAKASGSHNAARAKTSSKSTPNAASQKAGRRNPTGKAAGKAAEATNTRGVSNARQAQKQPSAIPGGHGSASAQDRQTALSSSGSAKIHVTERPASQLQQTATKKRKKKRKKKKKPSKPGLELDGLGSTHDGIQSGASHITASDSKARRVSPVPSVVDCPDDELDALEDLMAID